MTLADDDLRDALNEVPMNQPDPSASAKEILSGRQTTPEDALKLVKALERQRSFGLARRVLERVCASDLSACTPDLRLGLCQHHSKCTYKDPDLPGGRKLDQALRILELGAALTNTTNPETLGLAGAIHKRKWEFDGQRLHLERALVCYLKGHQKGDQSDAGYTGVNAAFVLDLLAWLDESQGTAPLNAQAALTQERRRLAWQIRGEVVQLLLGRAPTPAGAPQEWWFLVTVAEAYFGLGHFDEARPWLEAAAALPGVPDWERESTARQLAMLARLLANDAPPDEAGPASGALQTLLGGDLAAVRSVLVGKVGLALSGGGFRAALFHIGVLACLADLDLLRHVEVLSCVSGGSIIGAFYYLKLKQRLEAQPSLSRDQYLALVGEIEHEFLAGVKKNLRMRLLLGPWRNLRMAMGACSRTDTLAHLYEKHLFAPLVGQAVGPIPLNSLKVVPAGDPAGAAFNPKNHNWRRHAKVPMLVLNATTLNTGHNWQFTATWMGEPPDLIDDEVGANDRLRHMYHSEAPPKHRTTSLGAAVAASSCVPGLFPPLTLHGLYADRTVRLVDGGVYDNQGIAGLLEQGCNVIIVSDASGQSASRHDPGGGFLSALRTSNGVLMQRVREAEYQQLAALKAAGQLRAFAFVHLKKDLDTTPVDWLGCAEPAPRSSQVLAGYGIRKDVQARLASIRTDLDSFHDLEARALMYSGYAMLSHVAQQQLAGHFGPLMKGGAPSRAWRFLGVASWMRDPGNTPDKELAVLDVSRHRALKVWHLSRGLRWSICASSVPVLLAVGWALSRVSLAEFGGLAVWLVILGSVIGTLRRWPLGRLAVGLLVALPAVVVAGVVWVHLHVLDATYKREGAVP